MHDDQLLNDLRAFQYAYYFEQADKLEKHDIHSYSQLFDFLRDQQANEELQADACWILGVLRKKVDGRRAIPILLKLLSAEKYELRRAAIHTLGSFQSKRAVDPLLHILTNEQESIFDHMDSIYALEMLKDERIASAFERILFDVNEDVRLRALTIEWFPRYDGMLDTWIHFLSDPLPDLRFWAAYRLAQIWDDITPALAALDKVAAYDHVLPRSWGWHVDREALNALEDIYSRPYRLEEYGDDEGGLPNYGIFLISPASEYDTFMREYRHYQPDWYYESLPEPSIDLKLDSDWLRREITQAWPQATFDVRQPKLQTYLLDWYLQIEGQNLLGGLHRDQYGLVLTGKETAIYTFAAWYRSIIDLKHKLYIYEWADIGLELIPGISNSQIAQAYDELQQSRRAPAFYAKLTETDE